MKSQQGWTLVELAIVGAVAAILLLVALPAAGGAMESARASAARNDLLGSLLVASSQAALSGHRAVLCPSTDGRQCSDDPDWSQGWLVFSDPNASRELEGGESVLRRQGRLAGRVRLRSTAGRTRIVYQGNGGNVGSNVSFTLCDGRGPEQAVALVLSNSSRLRDGPPSPENVAATCVP